MTDDASGRLTTGVPGLDAALEGGVPTGSLVVLTAAPRAQSEPLLAAMAGANRARYLSTLRPELEVRDALAAAGAGDVAVEAVDGDDVLADPAAHLSGLESGSVVVVDPTTELEQGDRERYREFLDACKRALRMTDSVAVLHCHENTPAVLRRDMTLARADLVWDVRTAVSGGNLDTRLAVTKFRGGVPSGVHGLSFADGVALVDDLRGDDAGAAGGARECGEGSD
ncbi:MAG: RAD55 family ATPase [Halorientalis sp.]